MVAQGSSGFLHSPLWSQVSLTAWGSEREQTSHGGMSVGGKFKVAARAGQGVGGLMLKSGSVELKLAGGNRTLLCTEAKSQLR